MTEVHVSTRDPVEGREERDLVRATVFLRAAVSIVDRLDRQGGPSLAYPDVQAVLIETSQAAHRALVMLGEARHLDAERSGRIGIGDGVTAVTNSSEA